MGDLFTAEEARFLRNFTLKVHSSKKKGKEYLPLDFKLLTNLVFAVFVKDSKTPQWMVDLFTAEGARFLRNFTLKVDFPKKKGKEYHPLGFKLLTNLVLPVVSHKIYW